MISIVIAAAAAPVAELVVIPGPVEVASAVAGTDSQYECTHGGGDGSDGFLSELRQTGDESGNLLFFRSARATAPATTRFAAPVGVAAGASTAVASTTAVTAATKAASAETVIVGTAMPTVAAEKTASTGKKGKTKGKWRSGGYVRDKRSRGKETDEGW